MGELEELRVQRAWFPFLTGTCGTLALRVFILVQSAFSSVVGLTILLPNSWIATSNVRIFLSLISSLHSSQKSNMKILVALAVVFLVSTQLFAEEIRTNDDLNYWSDWSDSDQIKVSPGPKLAPVLLLRIGSCHFPLR